MLNLLDNKIGKTLEDMGIGKDFLISQSTIPVVWDIHQEPTNDIMLH